MRDGFEERGRWSGPDGADCSLGWSEEAGARLSRGVSPAEGRMPRML